MTHERHGHCKTCGEYRTIRRHGDCYRCVRNDDPFGDGDESDDDTLTDEDLDRIIAEQRPTMPANEKSEYDTDEERFGGRCCVFSKRHNGMAIL